MRSWFVAVLAVWGMVGCAGLPSGALPNDESVALSEAPSEAPSSSLVSYRPTVPAIDGEVEFYGTAAPLARITLWLGREDAQRTLSSGDETRWRDELVRLGTIACDARGAYSLSVRLPPRLKGADGPGLSLTAGMTYTVFQTSQAQPKPVRFCALTLAYASVPLPGGKPLSLALDTAASDARPTVVRGSGFGGTSATLVLSRRDTRFGDGPQVSLEVPVDAAGNVAYELRPDAVLGSDGRPFLVRHSACFVRLVDHATQKWLEEPWAFGQAELLAAASAPSIAFEPRVLLRSSLGPLAVSENAVLRSEDELASFMQRQGLALPSSPPERAEALRVDWERQQVVAVLMTAQPNEPWDFVPEIVAISEERVGYTVRTVKWNNQMPLGPVPQAYLATMPKSDRPVTFAPLVEAFEDQRPIVPTSRKKPERWF